MQETETKEWNRKQIADRRERRKEKLPIAEFWYVYKGKGIC